MMSRPVPVLMYHHVNPHQGDMVTVTPETFEGQMRHLRDHGYRTLSLDELLSHLEGSLDLPEKAVVVTFDDGWLDNYLYAFPVLMKYGIHAAVFAVTDWLEKASAKPSPPPAAVPDHRTSKLMIGKDEHGSVVLNWSLVREMRESGLVDFYSHTKSHIRCNEAPGENLRQELNGSKTLLEEKLGSRCPYLCWPYGKYSSESVAAARDAGYRAVFTTRPGVVRTGSDPFAIGRIVVKNDIPWFRKRIFVYTNHLLSAAYLKLRQG